MQTHHAQTLKEKNILWGTANRVDGYTAAGYNIKMVVMMPELCRFYNIIMRHPVWQDRAAAVRSTGEAKVFDFKPLLKMPAFAPLADMDVFRGVYIDYGTAVWCDGDIDIAPGTLYEEGILVENAG